MLTVILIILLLCLQARNAGNKEAIRRGTLMKMLQVTAQTLPLYISKVPGEEPPPLCGAIPAKSSHVAKVNIRVCFHLLLYQDKLTRLENYALISV